MFGIKDRRDRIRTNKMLAAVIAILLDACLHRDPEPPFQHCMDEAAIKETARHFRRQLQDYETLSAHPDIPAGHLRPDVPREHIEDVIEILESFLEFRNTFRTPSTS